VTPPINEQTNRSDVSHLSVDVVVVGGGPAGSAAAIELSRAGRSVIVLDKSVFPRDKCCGDGLTTLALRELELLGLDPGTIKDWFDVPSAAIRSPSGREVIVPLPTAGKYAAVAPRFQLDDALFQLARKEGADTRDGHGFQSLTEHDEQVVVYADGLRISTRYVIAADGMWSPVRKAVDGAQPGYLGEWHGFRQYGRNVTGPAKDQLYVWFEPDMIPGYAWSFPLPGGRVNIGFGILRDGKRRVQDMKEQWADLLRRPHILNALGPNFELEDRHTAWPIPAKIDQATLAGGRVLFTGDAAMATDVMTGEGIGQALLTGRLAAEAIVAAGASQPEYAAMVYEAEVRHHLVADHKMSSLLGEVLKRPWGARGAIRVVGASGQWGKQNFARWMFEDEPRAVALTPSRWHRKFLNRPGAYVSPQETAD
jgi:geranylgeranyl reductase family protein